MQWILFTKKIFRKLIRNVFLGVDWTNIILEALIPKYPKINKNTVKLSVLFSLFGIGRIKAAILMLFKLTLGLHLATDIARFRQPAFCLVNSLHLTLAGRYRRHPPVNLSLRPSPILALHISRTSTNRQGPLPLLPPQVPSRRDHVVLCHDHGHSGVNFTNLILWLVSQKSCTVFML